MINRNKSCIWMINAQAKMIEAHRLIETRVVFEWFTNLRSWFNNNWLIETRVVFEYGKQVEIFLEQKWLIETRVVFELGSKPKLDGGAVPINRNKSCIWIYKN